MVVRVRQRKPIFFQSPLPSLTQNGMLIGCKYRTLEKRFWQEKGTDKALYGLDDVREADEVITVEGEIDKVSVEEAVFHNCVSVPNGAPKTITSKELLPREEVTQAGSIPTAANRIRQATDRGASNSTKATGALNEDSASAVVTQEIKTNATLTGAQFDTSANIESVVQAARLDVAIVIWI